jgi:uncharacterized RDD family membrane protein YckC
MNKLENKTNPEIPVYAGLFRRLFAIFYDCFLLTAILFIIAAVATALNKGTAIEADNPFFPLYVFVLCCVCFMYFAWFWLHGGQTLGMKTWRLKLQPAGTTAITWKTVTMRFFLAMVSWGFCGLGFLWAVFDKRKRCWHDIFSKTVLIDLREQRSA